MHVGLSKSNTKPVLQSTMSSQKYRINYTVSAGCNAKRQIIIKYWMALRVA